MSPRKSLAVVLGSVLGSAAIVFAPVAQADDVEPDRGPCGPASSTASYRMRLVSYEDYRFTVSFAVFSDDLDEWDWKLVHNDDVSARGESQSRDADRSFRIVRRVIDAPGVDEVSFRAENNATGEVCRGVLSL